MNVEVTPLPGIGTRQDFELRSGRRIGVIAHRDGHTDLIVSKQDDPDSCVASIPMTPEESSTLAGLLGAPHLVVRLEEQHKEVTGITTRQLPIVPGSPFDDRTLGDTALRTRTAVSVVAVVRGGTVHPSPTPDFRFVGGDLLVTVGTTDGLAAAADLLETG
ncbi:Potassium channel TrkA, possible KefG analog required for KefB activity [Alloactinosynnema sp. L-07]|uniref:cation:proton antiporter regulatory subunit n=1 Tax=Alloactinosynnema sp. L-07 TaxID=1653480 RepID=UPI00065EFD37|nr:TrkA C-terminal domain-containing protein [Alloactinosynnema sp. L-07]CRK57995.1 Potassium channel TrkA, possible KefG analog required for KefB activity [Alloactinosynnema sp. L-07]